MQRQLNKVSYRLNLPPEYRISPSFHVSMLKPFTHPVSHPSTDPNTTAVPAPPVPVEEEPIYRVHNIMDSWRRGPHVEYLVDCENYGPEEHPWSPREDILDPTLLTQFHTNHPDHPAPRHRCRPCRCISPSQQLSRAASGVGGTVRIPSPSMSPVTPPTHSLSPEF